MAARSSDILYPRIRLLSKRQTYNRKQNKQVRTFGVWWSCSSGEVWCISFCCTSFVEATFVEIEFPLKGIGTQTFGSGKSLLIGSLYRPPSNTAAAIDTFCNSLQRCLTVVKASTSGVVFMGGGGGVQH